MRITIREHIGDHDPAATVELPKDASASIYATGDFASLMLNGITPAQIHDAIGCTHAEAKDDTAAAIVLMCGALLRARAELHHARDEGTEATIQEIDQALAAIEATRKDRLLGRSCADCDSGAEDIPPHDCTKYDVAAAEGKVP